MEIEGQKSATLALVLVCYPSLSVSQSSVYSQYLPFSADR